MHCPEPNHPPHPPCAATCRQAIIVLGRSGTGNGAAAQDELQALCGHLRQALAGTHVACAHVERASPSLPDALDACLQACPGVAQFTVQPAFVPVDHALLRWLEKVARRWRQRQTEPEATPRIVFAPPLGSLEGLAGLLARHLGRAASLPDVTQTTPERWQCDPAGWSKVPPHQRHVLLCMGPRCTAMGAAALWPHLVETLRRSGKLQKTALALQTSCQFPCNHGPLMIVYPEGLWYGRLDAAAISRIVHQHLDQGTVADAYRIHGPAHENVHQIN